MPTTRYLANMHCRMNQRGWPQDDKLLSLTRKAHRALLDLVAETRSGSTHSGVSLRALLTIGFTAVAVSSDTGSGVSNLPGSVASGSSHSA